jgi:hypothetical protein
MAGDTGKAKAAYNHLLTLWKDADPDIPILKQAKAEYAKLEYHLLCLAHGDGHRINSGSVLNSQLKIVATREFLPTKLPTG